MNRRRFFQTAAVPAGVALSRSPEAAKIRVTGLEVFLVRVNRRGDWVLFRMQTDAGLTGIGEASHSGRDGQAAALGKEFLEAARGRSIFDVEHLRRVCLPEVKRGGQPAATAFSGLEQCLWDLQGKALGVPVKLSDTPGAVDRPAPLLGQHTAEILGELGYTEQERRELERKGVV